MKSRKQIYRYLRIRLGEYRIIDLLAHGILEHGIWADLRHRLWFRLETYSPDIIIGKEVGSYEV